MNFRKKKDFKIHNPSTVEKNEGIEQDCVEPHTRNNSKRQTE